MHRQAAYLGDHHVKVVNILIANTILQIISFIHNLKIKYVLNVRDATWVINNSKIGVHNI